MKTSDQKYGNAVLRTGRDADGTWVGVVIVDKKVVGEKLYDDDEARLRARLKNVAGTVHPNYFGIDGAIARFRRLMPGGFTGPRYTAHDGERRYKVDAHKTLTALLPLVAALNATDADGKALAAAFKKDQLWTHMPSLQESTRLREVLAEHGAAFLQAAAKFAHGDFGAGIASMRTAIAPHGPLTWPIATYLPFLWAPERHMFLKPTVTRNFAERIGHRFAVEYSSDLSADVYLSLLALADDTSAAIEELQPADRIDVQSFIWVVGEYPEENLP